MDSRTPITDMNTVATPTPEFYTPAETPTALDSSFASSTAAPPAPTPLAPPALDATTRPSFRKTRQTWSPAPARSRSFTRPVLSSTQSLSGLSITHKEFNTHAHVSPADGRVHITVNALKDGPVSRRIMSALQEPDLPDVVKEEKEKNPEDIKIAPPQLNIVIMVIGSRGDVQPFIPIAKCLKEWGHRVRLATHGAFREFVSDEGLEFFDIGGNPEELMAFMVKNPGLLPNVETIKDGEIARRREQMFEMFQGFWRSCIEPSDRPRQAKNGKKTKHGGSSHSASDDEGWESEIDELDEMPFIADAIIANPPSFAHVHCAEKLGIPLHLMFTFPYSPTQEMAHPLAFIQNSNIATEKTNALTYPLVEMMTWQGLGDLVNSFRKNTLFLEPVATLWAPGMISRLKVPFTYMWSPALIPKPADWPDNIDITGFVFGQSPDYEPPSELQEFLDAGPTPIYIGFGSIVIDDPKALTQMIFDAVKAAGVRALISKGWGNLGEGFDIPENCHMLGNTPHNWLFSRVTAVIHHGGAGTTAIGLYHGKPTMIVPFFGDQAFWGSMIHNAGAGAPPCPHKELTTEKLTEGIKILLEDSTKSKAQEISRKIREEDGDGAQNAVRSFYKSLQEMDSKGKRGLGYRGMLHGEGGPMGPGEGKWGTGGPGIRCDVLEERVAVWLVRNTHVRISALAASWYVQHGRLGWKDLRLIRHTEWNDYDGPGEPFSGGIQAFLSSITNITKGVIGIPKTLVRAGKRVDDEVDLAQELHPQTTKKRIRRRFYRSHTATTIASAIDPTADPPIVKDLANGTKHSLKKISRSILRAPMDVSLAVAQGFHNAPRLYNDPVRRPARITGFHSGARAAGKEFALGIYDGFTGLVTQPYDGFKTGGPVGALKGTGKGVGGVILKPQAGLAGVLGYTLKGVHREMRKGRDRRVLERIMLMRRKQGEVEYKEEEGGEAFRKRMEEGWELVMKEREGEGDGGALRKLREVKKEKREKGKVRRQGDRERGMEYRAAKMQRREVKGVRREMERGMSRF